MKNSLRKTSLIAITVAALLSSTMTTSARAHDTHQLSAPTIDQRLYQLHNDRGQVRTGGPIAGLVISSILLPAGGLTLAAGGVAASWENFTFDEEEPTSTSGASKAMMATGAVAMVGGIVGVAISAKKVRDNREKLREIDSDLKYLQAESTRVSVSHGGPQKPATFRF